MFDMAVSEQAVPHFVPALDLLNTTPVQLWQGLFLAPTSVTIVGTEERKPGEVYFRCQTVGDVHHLLTAGEPVSYYGSFNDPFQF